MRSRTPQKCTGPGWQALEVQGQETLEVGLSITALVKEEQAQKRIERSPPWGWDSQLSSLLPAPPPPPPHPNCVLTDSSPDGLSDTLRSELVSQMECLTPSQMAQALFPSSPTGPASDGRLLAQYSTGSLSFYPEVSCGHSTGWCPCDNLKCLAHIVPVQRGGGQ